MGIHVGDRVWIRGSCDEVLAVGEDWIEVGQRPGSGLILPEGWIEVAKPPGSGPKRFHIDTLKKMSGLSVDCDH